MRLISYISLCIYNDLLLLLRTTRPLRADSNCNHQLERTEKKPRPSEVNITTVEKELREKKEQIFFENVY